PHLAEAVEPAAGADARELRLRVSALHRAQPDRAAGDVCLHPREVVGADPGAARRRQDAPTHLAVSLGVKAVENGFSVASSGSRNSSTSCAETPVWPRPACAGASTSTSRC